MNNRSISVLVVDDDATFRRVLEKELRNSGLAVQTLSSGEGIDACLRDFDFDVVVLDLRMPGMGGIQTLERIKALRPLTEVIVLTGHGSMENAVQTLKLGAHDFITKPCDLDYLESVIRNAAQMRAMRSENTALRRAADRHGKEVVLVGGSPGMQRLRALARKVAASQSTVLICGESGSGKDVVARLVHQESPRKSRPFVTLDCGATEEGLALSELFGHERGAYTGATQRKHGLFELADSGTILVDEIGDAPQSLQTRLLRVLETGTFRHLGGEGQIRVDVRILAATHRDLERRIADGLFREDLYYRLNVVSIHVPPLRDHIEDIPELVEHFLRQMCPGEAPTVPASTIERLQGYSWPGNIRELRNAVERMVILADGNVLDARDLPATLSGTPQPWDVPSGESVPSLHEVERRYLRSLIDRCDGQRGKVAAMLGISERTLYRKLRGKAGD